MCHLQNGTIILIQEHLAITNRKRTHMIEFGTLGNYKHVQNSRFCVFHTVILPSVTFLHELLTIDQNIYLLIKNDNNAHFAYELLWV